MDSTAKDATVTDPQTIANAGKRLAAIAAGRGFKDYTPGDMNSAGQLGDPSAEARKEQSVGKAAQAPAERSEDVPPPTKDSPTKSA